MRARFLLLHERRARRGYDVRARPDRDELPGQQGRLLVHWISTRPTRATPIRSSCGPRAAGSGSSLYCCQSNDSGASTCVVDTAQSRSAGATQYACTGTATPTQANSALLCGPGAVDGGPTTIYCCSTPVGSDAGAEASACSGAVSTGNLTCDQCLTAQCCATLAACDTLSEAGADDAGESSCRQLADCLRACLVGNADAGVEAGTLTSCSDLCGASFTATDLANAQPFVTCETTSCASQCL